MTHQIVRFLIASLLFTLTIAPRALAQTENTQTANDNLTAPAVAVETSPAALSPNIAHSDVGQPRAESAQRRPATPPPLPPRISYPRSAGPRAAAWRPGNRRHALIGALIGFGIGAALGAQGNRYLTTKERIDRSLLVGGVGAWLGAEIGNANP